MRVLRAALAPVISVAILSSLIGVAGASTRPHTTDHATSKTIVIGNEGFTESYIMQDIYGDLLKQAGYTVSLTSQASATRQIEIPALEHGSIDLVPDYAGSLLVYLAPKDTTQAGKLSAALAALNKVLAKHDAAALAGTAGLDQNVFVVTDQTKKKYHLTTISSIKKYAPNWTLGAPAECSVNYYCEPGLKKVYGLKFKQVKTLGESSEINVAALKQGSAQVVELFSTDDVIGPNKFYVLTDNKNLEPADHLIPVVRKQFDTAKLRNALAKVNSLLTTSVLTQLDEAPAGPSHPTPAQVATGFLEREKLIKS